MDDLLRGGGFLRQVGVDELLEFRRSRNELDGDARSQSGDRMSPRRTGTGCSSYGHTGVTRCGGDVRYYLLNWVMTCVGMQLLARELFQRRRSKLRLS